LSSPFSSSSLSSSVIYFCSFLSISDHRLKTFIFFSWFSCVLLASAPKRGALMEWNQILWKGDSNFSSLLVGHNKSRQFRLVWGCLIIN
jgi:hypothetical protein